jgi:hypothetical protein
LVGYKFSDIILEGKCTKVGNNMTQGYVGYLNQCTDLDVLSQSVHFILEKKKCWVKGITIWE